MMVGDETPVWANLGQTTTPGRHLPGSRQVYCPSDAYEDDCFSNDNPYGGSGGELFGIFPGQTRAGVPGSEYVPGDFDLFGLGQTTTPGRHLPGSRQVYCPSDAYEDDCFSNDNPYGGSGGELFGLGQGRIPEDVELRDLGQARVPEEQELRGLGQMEGQMVLGGLIGASVKGLIAWSLFRNAPKEKGFWQVVGYGGGALMALGALGVLAYGLGLIKPPAKT